MREAPKQVAEPRKSQRAVKHEPVEKIALKQSQPAVKASLPTPKVEKVPPTPVVAKKEEIKKADKKIPEAP